MTTSRKSLRHWIARWAACALICSNYPLAGSASASAPEGQSHAEQCRAAAAAWTEDGPGIAFDDIDPRRAVPLCEQAVAENPADGDRKAYLCRALIAAKQPARALEQCISAAEQGTAAGMSSLGTLYDSGIDDGVDWDDERAASRNAIASTLGDLGDTRAVEPLIARLDDEDAQVRSTVASALAELGDTIAVEPLIGRLDDEDAQVRNTVALALRDLGDTRAVEPLIARLGDGDPGVRSSVAEALGNLGDPRAVEPLIARLSDENSDVVETVACALGGLGDVRALEPLMSRLRAAVSDGDNDVASFVFFGLGDLAYALHGRGDPSAINPLIAGLEDDDAYVRLVSARCLGDLGDIVAVDPLIALLEDKDPSVRGAVAYALGELGDPGAAELLIGHLGDEDAEVQVDVAMALGDLGDTRAVQPLVQRLHDTAGDFQIRCEVAFALGRVGDVRAVEPLIGRLEDEDATVRGCVVQTLAELRDVRAVEPLIARLGDEGAGVRSGVASALGELGDLRAVEPLVARLKDEDSLVRKAAAEALGELGDPRAVEPLVARLKDEDSLVRKAAAEALGELGDPHAVEPLVARLKDKDSSVRKAAAEALGELGDTRAIEPLITYFASGEPRSWGSDSVARPLGKLGFSHPAITGELIDARGRDLLPALGSAPAYTPNLLRLVYAASAYATPPRRNDIVRMIWGWRENRAQGITLAQLASDFTALAAETDNPHGPAAANPLVHLFLARLLLADPAAPAERVAAADRHLASAWAHSRADETVLRLMITWLRAEAALRQDDAARAYDLLTDARALLGQVLRPERDLGLPLASYTLALNSYAASRQRVDGKCRYEEYGRHFSASCAEAAVDLSQQAERWLGGERDRFERWWDEQLDEAMKMEMDLLVKGFAVLARQRDIERL
jgi:HEAT repeat protein